MKLHETCEIRAWFPRPRGSFRWGIRIFYQKRECNISRTFLARLPFGLFRCQISLGIQKKKFFFQSNAQKLQKSIFRWPPQPGHSLCGCDHLFWHISEQPRETCTAYEIGLVCSPTRRLSTAAGGICGGFLKTRWGMVIFDQWQIRQNRVFFSLSVFFNPIAFSESRCNAIKLCR